ncbi:uncharacterized protein LOC144138904 isoform X1 [Haemaphysalis longicornis]
MPQRGHSAAGMLLTSDAWFRLSNFVMALFFAAASYVQLNDPDAILWIVPAAVAQWLRRCATEHEDAGSIPAAAAAFPMEAKSRNAGGLLTARFRQRCRSAACPLVVAAVSPAFHGRRHLAFWVPAGREHLFLVPRPDVRWAQPGRLRARSRVRWLGCCAHLAGASTIRLRQNQPETRCPVGSLVSTPSGPVDCAVNGR